MRSFPEGRLAVAVRGAVGPSFALLAKCAARHERLCHSLSAPPQAMATEMEEHSIQVESGYWLDPRLQPSATSMADCANACLIEMASCRAMAMDQSDCYLWVCDCDQLLLRCIRLTEPAVPLCPTQIHPPTHSHARARARVRTPIALHCVCVVGVGSGAERFHA